METLKTKVCAKCGHTLSVDKFYHNSHNADGYSDICRPCACKRKPSSGGGANPALAHFTPRELIAELRARGYRGKLEITQEVKV